MSEISSRDRANTGPASTQILILRVLSIALIAAWLVWQIAGPAVRALHLPAWVEDVSVLILAVSGSVLALRICLRRLPPHEGLRDGLLVLFAGALLIFELGAAVSSRNAGWYNASGLAIVRILPWDVTMNAPGAKGNSRALQAAWRDSLWAETRWQPVIYFFPPPGTETSAGTLRGSLDWGADTATLTLILQEGADGKVLWTDSFREPHSQPYTLVSKALDALRDRVAELPSSRAGEESPVQWEMPVSPRDTMDRLWVCKSQATARTDQGQPLSQLRERVAAQPDQATAHAALSACLLHINPHEPPSTGNPMASGVQPFTTVTAAWRHEARASANRALNLDPDLLLARRTAANVAWQLDRDRTKAEALWSGILQTYPNHAGVRLQRAAMLWLMGDRSEATQEARTALQTAPDHPDSLLNTEPQADSPP